MSQWSHEHPDDPLGAGEVLAMGAHWVNDERQEWALRKPDGSIYTITARSENEARWVKSAFFWTWTIVTRRGDGPWKEVTE